MRKVRSTFNYFKSMKLRQKNTLLLQNSISYTDYKNKEIPFADETSLKLKDSDISFFKNNYQQIILNSEVQLLTEEDNRYCKYNPKYLALKYCGSTDYWWLLMLVNGIYSVYEFENFEFIFIPNVSLIEELLNKKETNEKKKK